MKMLEKRISLCNAMVSLHFWCSVCGVLLFIPAYVASMACLTVGANSLYITFCYGSFEEYLPLAGFSALWFLLYPIVHLVCFFLAKRKRSYIPFLVLVCADTVFVIFAALLEWARDNLYGANMLLPDMVVSVVFSVVFSMAVRKYHWEWKKTEIPETAEGQEEMEEWIC